MQMFNPAHPGEILRDYMGDKITVTGLAAHLGCNRAHLSAILNGRSSVTPKMSMMLAETFGTSDDLWFGLQQQYDMAQARRMKRKKVPPLAIAA